MKIQMISLTVALAIALGMQTYTIYQLNDRISQLSELIGRADNPQMEMSNLPTLNPEKPGCDNSLLQNHIESL